MKVTCDKTPERRLLTRWRKGPDMKWKRVQVAPFEMWQNHYRKEALRELLKRAVGKRIGRRFTAKLERELVNYMGTQRTHQPDSSPPMDEYFRLLVKVRSGKTPPLKYLTAVNNPQTRSSTESSQTDTPANEPTKS
eukprot:TRINITY_DN38577_c0_g1_i1.p1 TRINITY_DN38577_c0_g1~~TRINITY_DN38577_c0_g1_i1.p1  ORF type:complete len:136 (+),score=28.87 TRINITY_DN38577_c0_g1_i1:34-441(+)